ncbi:MAG: phage shock protein operon transcriptional activator [Opitutales bacterium]
MPGRRSRMPYDAETAGVHRTPEALGESEAFLSFQDQLSRAAQVDRPTLLIGERGTGKELAASRLHYLSRRWEGPLITLNCSALTPSLIESELFGHEAGAFTGAQRQRPGRFEAADGGTLFLDEIGMIPMMVQEKILRVVEYGFFERVGGSDPIQVDVRIIGATNADLPGLARKGKFKEDLLDRLSFEVLYLPPLRARQEDILFLARHFAERMALELGREGAPRFSERAVRALECYPWPGNIRELKNVVERAVYTTDGDTIRDIQFDPFQNPYGETAPGRDNRRTDGRLFGWDLGDSGLRDALADFEVTALRAALEQSKYHQRAAAGLLGLNYNQFRGLYRKHQDTLT